MSRKQMLKKTTAVTLTVLIGLMLPVQVFAETLPEDETVYSSFDNVYGNVGTAGNIITEISENRTETTKEFLLDDGTKMIAEYDMPVHYQNDKGEWIEYNNSLVSESTASTADEAESKEYSNKSSDVEVKFSNKAKSNNMVKLSSEDYSISWGYDDVNKSKISLIENDEKSVGNEVFTTLKNITSEAKYEEVYENVDLQYFVTSTGVKENIILKDSDVQNEFNLTYKIKNLTAKQTDDYTITLYNKENKEVYKIVAPYMTDANGVSSDQLKLELVSQKGSNLNVKLTADYWFIHSMGRSFPVTIDPEVTNKLTSAMTFYENVNGTVRSYGPYYTSNNSYIIAKVNSLPQLDSGEKIISAKFNLEAMNYSTLFESEDESAIIINAHKLTAMESGVSEYDQTVLDYDSLTYNDNKNMTFDLTQLVNEWYDNGDGIDGFVLEAFDTIESKQVNIQYATSSSVTPSLTIIYKDFTGTESNLTYHNASVGYNATAEVSDYLGNLVITQNLYEGTGSRMPVTITATYNSINYNKTFGNGSPSGYGWQFSFNQYVRDASDELAEVGYDYIYTDSDGTDHYLKKADDSEEWYDEDGLGITLTYDENNIYIDNGSTTQTYELTASGGKLLSEKDEYNNTISYTYTNGNLTTITDGSGREISLTYYTNSDGENRVSKITRPDGKSIVFSYTSSEYDKLNYFSIPGSKVSRFYYNSDEMLTSVEQGGFEDGTYAKQGTVEFTYNDSAQVTKISEYGSDGTAGNYLNFAYGTDNTTEVTDRRSRTVTYTFDNAGNQISVLNANGYLESNDSSGLSVSSGADSFTKNYITESTEQNGIGSGKYYYKTNGARDGVTSSGGTVTIDTSEATEENGQVQYFGTTSIKVSNPETEDNSAFFTGATHQFDDTSFNGTDITFSAYVKTKDVDFISGTGAIGATLKIKCYDADGNTLRDVNSIGISETQDWQRLSISVTVPSETAYFRIYCNLRNASGTAWFDCLQLEEGNCANDFNALQDGNFETSDYWYTDEDRGIIPQDNTVTIDGEAKAYEDTTTAVDESTESETTDNSDIELPTTTTTSNYEVPDSYIFTYDEYGNVIGEFHGTVNKTISKVYLEDTEDDTSTETATERVTDTNIPSDSTASNNVLSNKYIYQNVKVGRAGVVFNLSGEAQAKSVPLSNENRTFGIALNIYYEGQTIPETHYQEFNASTTHRQCICMAVSPNYSEKIIEHVAFAFVYGYNENTMTIYNAMLNISTIPIEETSDDTTDIDDSSTDENVIEYDGYIYCEALEESKNTDNEYMQNTKTYDSTGNYVTSETNQAGYTVNYTYDVNGNVTSSTDAKSNTTNYTYNDSGNISKVSSGNTANEYFYNTAGLLSSISHNSFTYQFNYDVYLNLVSTKIGDVALATNTYNSNDGTLKKTVYANGDYLEYDSYDNIVEITGENGVISEFVYNKKGLVSKVIDTQNERTIYYYYDLNGNVEKKYCQSDEGDLSYYVTTNSDGEIIEKTSIHGYEKTIVRGTLNGESYVESDGMTVSKKTDDFERETQVKTTRTGYSSTFYTNYEYASGSETNSTTNLVSKITQKRNDSELAYFDYTYDANGNITQVKQNGTTIGSYKYDSLNQITEAYDRSIAKYTYYYYDNAGNLIKTKEHSVEDGVITGSYVEKTYTYEDDVWKDKLTSYNGSAIEYDSLGNPTSYRDMRLEWENGRNLKTIVTSDATIDMKYDFNGLRTQKDNGDKITYYHYDSNDNMIGLSYEENTVYFYYDSDGEAIAMSFNDTMYYYIKNLQGDVVKIVNQDGTTVVTYTYDAFGKIISQTDTTVYGIADLNPFRYRGYIYDEETGLYYLKSRYYDPETGRFINADIYCDTMSNILGTNMFTYCNNNPVNQVDPEGTDAYWLQFAFGASNAGHTSLLLQDSVNNWWYFYWGPRHAYLKPCGEDDFTSLNELNSYLSGFDPRKGHNYYVYATSIFNSKEDRNRGASSEYYLKCNDGTISNTLKFYGKFASSFTYAKNLLEKLYSNSNATQLTEIIYEGGEKYTMYHVCVRNTANPSVDVSDPDEVPSQFPLGYYYTDIVGNGNCKSYSLFSYNCVQASMDVLLQGDFDSDSQKYKDAINKIYGNFFKIDMYPNSVFCRLLYFV